jgi:NMD protein affecting ribosome stability and mRNA decay
MPTRKPYTNVTFTKRVDHEAGRHRPPRAPREPASCPRCGAFYAKRRWVPATQAAAAAARTGTLTFIERLCPACRKVQAGVPSGFVDVDGAFAAAHLPELMRLIENEATRAAEDNPTARIIQVHRRRGGLIVTTTTEHLAQRLGQALVKAYGGDVHYDFSHENKLARVRWHRD